MSQPRPSAIPMPMPSTVISNKKTEKRVVKITSIKQSQYSSNYLYLSVDLGPKMGFNLIFKYFSFMGEEKIVFFNGLHK